MGGKRQYAECEGTDLGSEVSQPCRAQTRGLRSASQRSVMRQSWHLEWVEDNGLANNGFLVLPLS